MKMCDVPGITVNSHAPSILTVGNLPLNYEAKRIRNRLRMLIENCGGKILDISTDEGFASIRFGNIDSALRAQRRIQGEDVFGNKIKVLPPSVRGLSGRRLKNGDVSQPQSIGACGIPTPPPVLAITILFKIYIFTR
ncbi:hypothetical protein NQ317_017448 [Molorchus minor]|uniref:RRM domain-containing protein n=1 Tax=Molorchus minor TaxID=1323400 RepID=A0ABQ9JF69_9CUCU|nr:hypothetical protein NQ317_017448 [Molorchus minor]